MRSWHPVLRSLAVSDPELAIQTALDQPLGERSQGLEVSVISSLSYHDIERAIEFLTQVREGNSTLAAYRTVGYRLIGLDDYDRALSLGTKLPESQRQAYYDSISQHWSHSDPVALFESLDRIPQAESRSRAAMHLVTASKWSTALSADQLDVARNYISQSDLERMERQNTGTYFVRFEKDAASAAVDTVIEAEILDLKMQEMAEQIRVTLGDEAKE